MATEGNEDDIANLSDEELEARQRAEDGEDASHNPSGEGEDTQGGAAQADPPVPTPEPTPAPTQAPAAAPVAGAEGTKIEGVLNKDGTRVLPYGALQAERRAARAANGRADRAEKELEIAKQQLADIKAGKVPVGDLTEEDVAQMETDFPEQGAKMRALFEKSKTAASTPAPPPAEDDDPAAATQELIDQVPLLLEWQHNDAEKFARAVQHDALLMKSPKWADKPAIDRFTEATRRTADEYDIAFEEKPKASTSAAPAATPAPTAAPADPAQGAQRKPPESLSDFKGGATPDHGSLDVNRATPRALLARFEDMSDEEIDAQLAKLG